VVGCEDPLRDKISDLVKLHLNTSPNHALRDRDRVVARDLGLSTYPNTVCERDVVIELSAAELDALSVTLMRRNKTPQGALRSLNERAVSGEITL
jgi:hypothetical protein